jgi:hypothetical protein
VAACDDGLRESASRVSEPRTTCDELAFPLAGTSLEADVPAFVIAVRACVWEAAAAPMLDGVMASAAPEAWLLACERGVRGSDIRESVDATAPMLEGVMASDPPVACDTACWAGWPPPRAAIAPHVTFEVSVPSAVSAGTTRFTVAVADGREEMVVFGISISR